MVEVSMKTILTITRARYALQFYKLAWIPNQILRVKSAPHLRSCRFIAVTRARLKVPAKNLPLVEEKRTSWLIPFLSTHTVKLMEMEHAMDAWLIIKDHHD